MTHVSRQAALSASLLLAGCYGAPVAPPPAAPVANGYSTGPVAGTTCYAGVYVCAMPSPGAVGSSCACPGLGAPSFGTVH